MDYRVPKKFSKEWLVFSEENRAAFKSIDRNLYTKEGLFPCEYLKFINNKFWFKKVNISPNQSSRLVANYLYRNKVLWRDSSIRITDGVGTSARALMYGVNFKKAVEEALTKRYVKSLFYLPEEEREGVPTFLLIHLNDRKDIGSVVTQLQAWQYSVEFEEVHYIHAESNDRFSSIYHLDGAIIFLGLDDRKALFRKGDKVKGEYKKQFRVDGRISLEDFHSIMGAYLPVQQLTDEAFWFAPDSSETVLSESCDFA